MRLKYINKIQIFVFSWRSFMEKQNVRAYIFDYSFTETTQYKQKQLLKDPHSLLMIKMTPENKMLNLLFLLLPADLAHLAIKCQIRAGVS